MPTFSRVYPRSITRAALVTLLACFPGGDGGVIPAGFSQASKPGIHSGGGSLRPAGVPAAAGHVRPAVYRLPRPGLQNRLGGFRPTIQIAARNGAPPDALMDTRPTVRPVEELELAQASQPVRIVHFWATWCPPCIEELDAMASFYSGAYQGLHARGLELILISNDLRVEDIHRLTRNRPLPGPVYFDPFGDWRDVLGIPVLPATVILDGEGRVLERRMGRLEWQSEQFLRRLRDYLGESTTT